MPVIHYEPEFVSYRDLVYDFTPFGKGCPHKSDQHLEQDHQENYGGQEVKETKNDDLGAFSEVKRFLAFAAKYIGVVHIPDGSENVFILNCFHLVFWNFIKLLLTLS